MDSQPGGSRLDYGVVVPTRGRRRMLLAALESVFAQTVRPREVVVVIDGDTDGSADAVREAYPTAVVVVHEESVGPARSRAEGVQLVTAEWVCLLDDDDIWHSGKQHAAARYLDENPGCVALRTAFWQFAEDPGARQLNGFRTEIFTAGGRAQLEHLATTADPLNDFDYLDIEGRSLAAMLRKNCGVTSSTMVRRDVLARVPEVPGDLRTGEDWLLFVGVARLAEWHLVPGRWFFYRIHGGQGTQDARRSRWEDRVRAWGLAWPDERSNGGLRLQDFADEYADEVRGWVWQAVRRGDLRQAREIMWATRHLVDSPIRRLSVAVPPPLVWRLRRLIRTLPHATRQRASGHSPPR